MPGLFIYLIGVTVLFQRLGELKVHRDNVRFLEFIGGLEVGRPLSRLYMSLDIGAVVLLITEAVVMPKSLFLWQKITGITMLFLGLLLRVWSRKTIGRYWSLRLFIAPQMEVVSTGPYRFFPHPEYFSRFIELLGLSLLLGSYFSFLLYSVCLFLLIPKLLRAETQQLQLLEEHQNG